MSREVKLFAVVRLRKFILIIFFCVACPPHSATPLFGSFKPLQVFVPSVIGGACTPAVPEPITTFLHKKYITAT